MARKLKDTLNKIAANTAYRTFYKDLHYLNQTSNAIFMYFHWLLLMVKGVVDSKEESYLVVLINYCKVFTLRKETVVSNAINLFPQNFDIKPFSAAPILHLGAFDFE